MTFVVVSNPGPIACLAHNQQLCVVQQHTNLVERVNGIQFDEWKPKLPLMMVLQVSIVLLVHGRLIFVSKSNDNWHSQVLSQLCMLAMILNARTG